MKVLHLCLNFVLPSEVFLFRQCQSREEITCEVATINRFGESAFPHGTCHLLRSKNQLLNLANLIGKKLKALEWWDRLECDKMLESLLETSKPDVIHIHNGWTATRFARVLQNSRVRKVLSLWGSDVTSAVRGEKYLNSLKEVAASSGTIVFHSNFLKQRFNSIGPIGNSNSAESVKVIYPGIDVSAISRPLPKIDENGLRILCIARLSPVKGHRYLFEAIKILAERKIKMQLVVVGDGPLNKNLHELVTELQIEHYVNFHGSLPPSRVFELIEKSHIVVLPSITLNDGQEEAFGVSLIEAGACGRPVIATNSGGISEVVINQQTGILVPQKNSLELAAAIEYYFNNVDKMEIHGKNAYEHIFKNFSIQAQLTQLNNVYREISI